jgi:hypothetical protein
MSASPLVRIVILGFCLLFQATHAQAAIRVFNLVNATFGDGTAHATGTVTVDTTSGLYTGVQITVTDTSAIYGNGTASFLSLSGQASFDNGTHYFFNSFSANGDLLNFELPVPNLIAYAGGPICPSATCGSSGYVQFSGKSLNAFTGGALSPVPNPASSLLLGSGLCFLLAARTRLVNTMFASPTSGAA